MDKGDLKGTRGIGSILYPEFFTPVFYTWGIRSCIHSSASMCQLLANSHCMSAVTGGNLDSYHGSSDTSNSRLPECPTTQNGII
jgi:hypothetical protein